MEVELLNRAEKFLREGKGRVCVASFVENANLGPNQLQPELNNNQLKEYYRKKRNEHRK